MSWFSSNEDVLRRLELVQKEFLKELAGRQANLEMLVDKVNKMASRMELIFGDVMSEVDHLKRYSQSYVELLERSEKQIIIDALTNFIRGKKEDGC